MSLAKTYAKQLASGKPQSPAFMEKVKQERDRLDNLSKLHRREAEVLTKLLEGS